MNLIVESEVDNARPCNIGNLIGMTLLGTSLGLITGYTLGYVMPDVDENKSKGIIAIEIVSQTSIIVLLLLLIFKIIKEYGQNEPSICVNAATALVVYSIILVDSDYSKKIKLLFMSPQSPQLQNDNNQNAINNKMKQLQAPKDFIDPPFSGGGCGAG